MAALIPDAAHWAIALVPVLVLLAVFVWLDAFELMSFREIVLLLVLGGFCAVAVYPVSGPKRRAAISSILKPGKASISR
jgi:RsiW-degrading membrane proteinase PrsW (M82 family)